ncbi:MAG: MFS transporter [Chloroflexi bacterium]|nr:MFS transporter [Chloroflexota bacterium]
MVKTRLRQRLLAVGVAWLLALSWPGVALADEAHAGGGIVTSKALWAGVPLAALALGAIAYAFWRAWKKPRKAAEGGWLYIIAHFSHNAKLFLAYSLLSEVGAGIWRVMFNLYLLALGFNLDFIGVVLAVNFLFHGLFAFPAGLIADKFGRRFTFALAIALAVLSRGALLFTTDPLALLVLMGLSGAADGFHAVAGGPFIMENTRPEERPYLFSLNSAFLMLSLFAGALSAGFITVFWGNILEVIPADPLASRMALAISLPLTLLALPPLLFISERRLPADRIESFKELFTLKNIQSHAIIGRLFLCSLIVGLGFGFVTPFFNVFFREVHRASYETIGTIMSLGTLGAAAITLFSPMMVKRWGRVRSIAASTLGSIPFLMLIVLIPALAPVAIFYIARMGIYSVSMPLRQQLAMELVVTRERGTANGLVHMAFDVPVAPAAFLAGVIMATGNYLTAFSLAGAILVIPAFLYYSFFAKLEQKKFVPALASGGLVRPVGGGSSDSL